MIYCGLFGATIAAFVGLNSVILVDLLGLDKLTNALGLVFLFQGIASLIGPPIIGDHNESCFSLNCSRFHLLIDSGRLKDMLGSYNPGFYLAGAMISVSGLMLFLIPCFLRPEKKSPSPRTVAVHSDFFI